MELDLIEYDIDPRVKEKLEEIIQMLLYKISAGVVMLSDDAGRIVSIKGGGYRETDAEFLATLISGIFGAAVEMGKIINMQDLEILQYESKNIDVVIKFIPPRFLLGIIVKKDVSIGTVRLFLKEASAILEKVLKDIKLVPVREIKIDVKDLEKKLNEILGERS
ncbi:MAG: roadblock/LC7 domain-containing protein [Aquificaceae bacterium]